MPALQRAPIVCDCDALAVPESFYQPARRQENAQDINRGSKWPWYGSYAVICT